MEQMNKNPDDFIDMLTVVIAKNDCITGNFKKGDIGQVVKYKTNNELYDIYWLEGENAHWEFPAFRFEFEPLTGEALEAFNKRQSVTDGELVNFYLRGSETGIDEDGWKMLKGLGYVVGGIVTVLLILFMIFKFTI